MRPPVVLHCFGSYLPMTENWVFRLIRHVPGCTQLVAAPQFHDNDFYLEGVEYLVPPVRIAPGRHRGPAYLWRVAESLLARVYPLYLRLRLRHRDIDIVHSHFANIGWRFRALAKALGAVHVVSFYGWDYEHLATVRPQWKARMPQLFRSADLLVCEGPHGADVLRRLGCAPAKIRVCRLGVEPDRIPMFRRDKAPGSLRLLQIASFREKKGHVYAARAFVEAAADCPGATLTLVGSGDAGILAQVHACIREAGLEDRVSFVPQIDFSRLHDFMRDYHVFIHPSVHTALRDCEGGAPIVLLDAQATGMPVISTLHCDIPDEVVDGVTGILAPERDVTALATAIRRFHAMEQDEYDAFAERARQHVVAHFDAVDCSAHLAALYGEALASRLREAPSAHVA